MRWDRLPLTYLECHTRFEHAARAKGFEPERHAISARGPQGEELAIQVVQLGASRPRRALVVLSGVHGVEGFIGSALQTSALGRWDPALLPRDAAVVLVHSVNPWGMAWWRRQNEHNVDLNRNWMRSRSEPVHNEAYDTIHHLACPDTPDLPAIEDMLASAAEFVATHGTAWLRDAITAGQYRHPDGLHYGGNRTEESCEIVERVMLGRLGNVERLLTLDLHTGHGPPGAITLLSDQPIGSPQDEFLRRHFGAGRVEATAGNPAATTGLKHGQIANGLAALLPQATCFASSVEFGTTSDMEQLVATYHEQWVHRRGDRRRSDHAAVVWSYRSCFTPDDPAWEHAAMTDGTHLLDTAIEVLSAWV